MQALEIIFANSGVFFV